MWLSYWSSFVGLYNEPMVKIHVKHKVCGWWKLLAKLGPWALSHVGMRKPDTQTKHFTPWLEREKMLL